MADQGTQRGMWKRALRSKDSLTNVPDSTGNFTGLDGMAVAILDFAGLVAEEPSDSEESGDDEAHSNDEAVSDLEEALGEYEASDPPNPGSPNQNPVDPHPPYSTPDHNEGSGDDSSSPRNESNSSGELPLDQSLSKSERVYRVEAVRSRMGVFVLSLDSIIEHLRHVNWDVDTAVDSLERAHDRAYNDTQGTAGRPRDLELPTHIQGIPIPYFRTGEQERRSAADIFFLLIEQMNLAGGQNPQILLARSEAVLILQATGFDFESALVLVQRRDFVNQLLHIRFDNLRTRSGTAEHQTEQSDAAIAYLLTLTDRADMGSMQQHLTTHGGDLVAAVADWQQNGVDPIQQQDGRRHMFRNGLLHLRPMPSSDDAHEYTALPHLAWRQEPNRFAPTTTDIGNGLKEQLFKQPKTDRKNRPTGFVINHNRDPAKINCPDSTKFLIEYIAEGKYRSNGFDAISEKMKVRQARYFWGMPGTDNASGLSEFDFSNRTMLNHLNAIYRQGYFRPTGIITREAGADWDDDELEILYDHIRGLFEELHDAATSAGKEVELPFHIPETKKEEISKELLEKSGNKRTKAAIMTMTHRTRSICRDFMFKFDASNESNRLEAAYGQLRESQATKVSEALQKEGVSLSREQILATIEQISDRFSQWAWTVDMPVDAVPPPRRLPTTGAAVVSLEELQGDVTMAMQIISAGPHRAWVWRYAGVLVRHFYSSEMGAPEIAAMHPVLDRMGFNSLDLSALSEEEALAIFRAFTDSEQEVETHEAVARATRIADLSTSVGVAVTAQDVLDANMTPFEDDLPDTGAVDAFQEYVNGRLVDMSFNAAGDIIVNAFAWRTLIRMLESYFRTDRRHEERLFMLPILTHMNIAAFDLERMTEDEVMTILHAVATCEQKKEDDGEVTEGGAAGGHED